MFCYNLSYTLHLVAFGQQHHQNDDILLILRTKSLDCICICNNVSTPLVLLGFSVVLISVQRFSKNVLMLLIAQLLNDLY